jgi:hypothetical protein
MMRPRVMFTLIIGKVFHPGVPLERIHILCIFFASLKISHFYCSRSLLFDGVVCDADSHPVITMYWYFGLFMSEVFQGEFKNHPLLAIQEQCSQFCFGRRRYDKSQYRTQCVKCAVEFYGFSIDWYFAHEKMPTRSAACTRFAQIQSI